MTGITCPFCGEQGFDKIGLKIHFELTYCKEYEDIYEGGRYFCGKTYEEEHKLRVEEAERTGDWQFVRQLEKNEKWEEENDNNTEN